jgi:hypothetical protein
MLPKANLCIVPGKGVAGLVEAVRKIPAGTGWAVVATYSELVFEKWTGANPRLDASFRGHVFSPEREVRWVREGESVTWWELFEDRQGEACEVRDRRNYLWGYWNGHKGEESFREGRMTQPFIYPVADPQTNDRAYVQIREYLRIVPGGLQTPDDWMRELNKPLVRAWRMLGVDKGSDPLPGGEE